MTPFHGPDAGGLFDAVSEKNSNGNGKNTLAWIVVGIAVVGTISTPFGLLYNNQSTQGDELRRLRDKREQDLASIATLEAKLAASEMQFVEVETQFRAFKDRMLENEQYTKERADQNAGSIFQTNEHIRQLADGEGRLDERVKRLEHIATP